jgi:hypothetical protein
MMTLYRVIPIFVRAVGRTAHGQLPEHDRHSCVFDL